ncbi:hypothetical protein BKA61DRAFT_589404 [Leptodontidium sp. MPI-SDFR-AT-0119]|nr:hypothetical protein BKA61DRAFT_589404 [Leptodontidium sp. MPI-SDFR-AT-0119]
MLTSIHLRLIRENHLAHLLSVTRALTTLRWDWYYCPEPPSSHAGSPSLINLDKLAVDLTRLRLTLREPIIGTQSTLGQGLEILFLTSEVHCKASIAFLTSKSLKFHYHA